MAEAEEFNTLSASSPQTAPISKPRSVSLPERNSLPQLSDHQPHQVPGRLPQENSAPEPSDDEVEFVFAVPRRRKKKRRRLELLSQDTHIDSASSIPSAEIGVTHPSSDKPMADMIPLLDSGIEHNDIDMASRSANALHPPTTLESISQPLNVLQSELSESPLSHTTQNIPFKIPPAWYTKSMAPPPSPTSSYYYSKSTIFTAPDQDCAKKRTREEDPPEYSNYLSPYVSSTSMYQSRPKALPSQPEHSPITGHTGFVEFLEDPNVPATFGGVALPLSPHQAIIPGWQNFSWKPPDHLPPRSSPSVDVRKRILSDVDNDPEWHRKYHYGAGRCINSQQISTGNLWTERFAHEMVSPKSMPHEIRNVSPYSPTQENSVSGASITPTKLPAFTAAIQPVLSSSMGSPKTATQRHSTSRAVTVRSISPSPHPLPQVTAEDIRRRPSLYKIPAWPHSTDDNQASSSAAFCQRLHQTGDTESSNQRFLYSNITQQAKPALSHTSNVPPYSLHSPTPKLPKQQIPTPKHSPNLIIDIAQTSQETFPFAAVATRHNKPIQKVFDTFSAIIQLPLLKQAADGRRHGPLGSERMRQYREAKRAMERANREKEKGKGMRRDGE